MKRLDERPERPTTPAAVARSVFRFPSYGRTRARARPPFRRSRVERRRPRPRPSAGARSARPLSVGPGADPRDAPPLPGRRSARARPGPTGRNPGRGARRARRPLAPPRLPDRDRRGAPRARCRSGDAGAGGEDVAAPSAAVCPRGAASGVLRALPPTLPPLLMAFRLQQRAAGVGFDWPDATGPLRKVQEELDELERETRTGTPEAIADEMGDVLFAAVNVSRKLGVDPRAALERANDKFRRRFEALEQLAERRGLELGRASLEELDALWDEVKRG